MKRDTNKLCNNLTLFQLILLLKVTVGSITWSYFHVGGYTTEGLLGQITAKSLSHCAVECHMTSKCEVIGYWQPAGSGVCLLYTSTWVSDVSILNPTSFEIDYYAAKCGPDFSYNYIKALDLCLSDVVREQLTWEDAVNYCYQTGTHLMYAKTPAVLDWLYSKLTPATEQRKFWLGGFSKNVTLGEFFWLSGEEFKGQGSEGENLWLYGYPQEDRDGCLEFKYAVARKEYGIRNHNCSERRTFICQADNF